MIKAGLIGMLAFVYAGAESVFEGLSPYVASITVHREHMACPEGGDIEQLKAWAADLGIAIDGEFGPCLTGHSVAPNHQGSGFVWRHQVVTNCHVLRSGAYRATLNGAVYPLKYPAGSPPHDLCELKAEQALPAGIVAARPAGDLRIGERVYALGAPSGLANTISDGIVSGIREVGGVRYVQFTAPVSPGSSGGPLVDQRSRELKRAQ